MNNIVPPGTIMWFFFPPTQKPTGAEYIVIIWSVSLLCIVLGIVALIVAVRAPAEKHALALLLGRRGVVCIGIGIAIQVCYWVYRRLID